MKVIRASKNKKQDYRDVVCSRIKACIESISECDQSQEVWAKNSIADLAVIMSDIQSSKTSVN